MNKNVKGKEQRFTIKEVYNFTSGRLRSWFPLLPTYAAFVMRISKLSEAFRLLLNLLIDKQQYESEGENFCMVDSMPIITCSGKRSAKVARSVTDKGCCSTKLLYYHGIKLHFLATGVRGTIPVPESIIITPASENDLNVFRDNWSGISGKTVFADKAYLGNYMQNKMLMNNSELLAPVKYPRGTPNVVRLRNAAADKLFSQAVSSIRQPIESLFAWLILKSDIQRASNVRSEKGLMVHIFAKLAAAFTVWFIS